MRAFVYGMQSSGSSLVAYFMSQGKDTYAIVDNYNRQLLPEVSCKNIVAKCTISLKISVEEHIARFKPDITILVLRQPYTNYVSLSMKPYGEDIDEKFRIAEKVFLERSSFDLVIRYEDFVLNPTKVIQQLNGVGWAAEGSWLSFPRSREEIMAFNQTDPSLRIHKPYAFGNLRSLDGKTKADSEMVFKPFADEVRERVYSLCPMLCEFYEEIRL